MFVSSTCFRGFFRGALRKLFERWASEARHRCFLPFVGMQVATASENTPSKDLLRGMLALSMRTSSPLLPYRVGFLDCRSKHRERVGSHFSKDCSEERSNEIVCVRRCGNARQIHVETRWPATCLVRVGLQMSVLKASTGWGAGRWGGHEEAAVSHLFCSVDAPETEGRRGRGLHW